MYRYADGCRSVEDVKRARSRNVIGNRVYYTTHDFGHDNDKDNSNDSDNGDNNHHHHHCHHDDVSRRDANDEHGENMYGSRAAAQRNAQ